MNITVVSYSFTGNNRALAASVARELGARHIDLACSQIKSMMSTALSMLGAPRVKPAPEAMEGCDLVLFVAPVWMGHVAAPLRTYLRHLKKLPRRYGFLSVSGGGAEGGNVNLAAELERRAGAKPAVVVDLPLTPFLSPAKDKAEGKDLMTYRVSEADLAQLTDTAVKQIREII